MTIQNQIIMGKPNEILAANRQKAMDEANKRLKELEREMMADVQAELGRRSFPIEKIAFGFVKWLEMATQHETACGLDVEIPVFRQYLANVVGKKVGALNLLEMGMAINSVLDKSMHQLDCDDVSTYFAIIDSVKEMGNEWNRIKDEVTQPIVARYTSKANQIKNAANLITR